MPSLLLALFLVVVLSALAASGGAPGWAAGRDRATERALAQAREALIAYAAERPIGTEVGPGYLPCPDADGDGWSEPTCGSLSGHLGQAERLGWLPWKTLGLPELRDGAGERLWYAVSTRHKGLLNCAASRECRDMAPGTALGTITVRDASGRAVHDGTLADPARAYQGGAVAVVISAGAPLVRADGREQRRGCAARCDPADFLDVAPARAGGEDNAAFVDRTDVRAGNADGFIQGPVAAADGSLAVNDRVLALGYGDLMPRVLARVAHEIAHCIAATPAPPEPACAAGEPVGRVSDLSLGATTCNARAEEPAWWIPWRPHVLYASGAPAGLEVVDASGRSLATGRRFAVIATERAGECAAGRITCDAAGCTRLAASPRHEALVSVP